MCAEAAAGIAAPAHRRTAGAPRDSAAVPLFPRARSPLRASLFLCLGALLLACAPGRTPLVIYSPHGHHLLGLFEQRFEAAHPDVDVRWLDMGSQEVLDRLRAERANPQADVWFGGPSTIFARGARDSLLEPYRPSWADAIEASGRGPGDLWFALYETPAVLIYARDAVRAEEAPQDWDDLLDARWTGKVLIRDPLASGTMRAVWGMIIERELRRTGDTAAGFGWLRRLDAQTREYVLNGPILNQKLVRREGLVSTWDLPDVLLNIRDGLQLAYTFPRSGAPVIPDAIGIVRGTRRQALARAFVEFVGTSEAQLLAAREVARLPARRDLPEDALPEWVRDVRRRMVVADVDWGVLEERGSAWMQYWDRNVRGRGSTH
jgi:iron(III) transport system substrate-binding protein